MLRGSLFALASSISLALPGVATGAEPEEASDTAAQGGDADAKAKVQAPPPVAPAPPKGAAMKKRVGFGAIRTLSGVNGLFVNGYVANRITAGLAIGVATFTHRETNDNGEFTEMRTFGRLGIGPEVFFFPVQGDRDSPVHADFGFGARVMTFVGFLGRDEDEQGNTLDTPLEIGVELPAKIALWIGRRVAILPEFGLAFRIVPGSREADMNGEFDNNPGQGVAGRLGGDNGPGFGFEIGDHAGLFMGIGLGFYFGKI